jgi:hypothetical protein
MDVLDTLLAVLTGVGVRFAIPVGITILMIYFLRKLDARWQAEGQLAAQTPSVEKPKCWEANNCSPQEMEKCPGYQSAQPCWQAFRTKDGHLKEECLGCGVFHHAPIPSHP